jgi:AAA15 family ATPase/GTPase
MSLNTVDIEFTIKNYSCFSDTKPARFTVKPGFTAFLGINNSGKSSLLRFFYEFRDLFKRLASTGIVASDGERQRTILVNSLNGAFDSFSFPPEIIDHEEVFCNANNRDMLIQVEVTSTSGTEQILIRLDVTVQRPTNSWTAKMYLDHQEVPAGNLHWKDNSLYRDNELVTDLSDLVNACEPLGNMVYIPSFRNAINIGASSTYYDIPIGQDFITRWNNWKTGPTIRYHVAANQVQKDIAKIFEYSQLEINASSDGQRLHMMINDKSYKISELGSGLTQFFLVLTSAAMRSPSPSFILIDEPEINLHPSLQLDFLTRLTSYATDGIFFATHSIGLARASADHIYSVRRGTDDLSEITDYNSTPRLAELLGELSFAGYKELGFDKILLVEGSSEVKTIQQFLRWYKKEHQIVLLPMGGDQMINPEAEAQLEEIKRISENVSALIDSERSAEDEDLEPKRVAFKKLCDAAKIPCHILKRRAIENYFPDHAVQKVKGDTYRALQPYEQFKYPFTKWAKSENWQIAREMVPEDLEGTDLGKFLQSL